MTKLHPIQRPFHPAGQSGMLLDCEWIAITLAGTSHTEHLKKSNDCDSQLFFLSTLDDPHLEIYFLISDSMTGIIGMGAVVLSQ